MRAFPLAASVLALLGLTVGSAGAQYRHPSSCQDGCMTVSAYRDHGGRTDWNCGGITYGGHGGTDFAIYGGWGAVDEGREVLAAADGVVVEANDGEFDRCTSGGCSGGGGFGNYVAIQHGDGVVTYYGHQRAGSIAVGVGDTVRCGQHLGFIASSGASTGPHLHFEPRDGGAGFEPFGFGGCSDPWSRWNDQGPYAGLPGQVCPMLCTPHCEGSVVVDASCGMGDCAPYASRCVDDALGARCAFFACPDVGAATVCLPDGHTIGNCHDGAIDVGDCAAYGARCTDVGGPARCAFFACPDVGTTTVCLPDGHTIGTCRDGAIETGDCAAYGAYCSTQSAGGAVPGHCASVFCVASADEIPHAHDTCLPDGRIVHCTDDGSLEDARACPAGATCTPLGAGAECIDPSAPDAGPPVDTNDAGTQAPVDAGVRMTIDGGAPGATGDGAAAQGDASMRGGRAIDGGGCSVSPLRARRRATWLVVTMIAAIVRGRRRRAPVTPS